MNPICPRCGAGCSVKYGRYHRSDDAQSIQRYRCGECGKCHSSATHTPTYRQKRRRLNRFIEADLASSTSQRRIAKKLRCARKTVARKLEFLAEEARKKTQTWLHQHGPFDTLQWDELISFEHSRLKPLAQVPASGQIAKRSREKYGKRQDRSGAMRRSVLEAVEPHVSPYASIKSDEHARYTAEIKKAYPDMTHIQYPSVRGSLTGQGELKRTGFDPLFGINHTLAMMRDGIKRLTRQTWCTTKNAKRLEDAIAVYVNYHNTELIPQPKTQHCDGDFSAQTAVAM